ncbi:hypothetical protein [Haloarchaeobius amylolyticus]|uniref:hypothetical protein n=1 Tax=Haloarchaeobius amylolyticus TaxID=1198296 RepID=UPI00226F66A1|nr:hypothetical protein [Haloarchaeobius amylolyticus]
MNSGSTAAGSRRGIAGTPSRRFALFFLGVVLLTLAAVLTIGAIRVALVYDGTAEAPEARWSIDRTDLTAADRAAIDRAIAGERIVYESPEAAPGPGRGSLAVYDAEANTWHVFRRRVYVDFGTTFGQGAALSAITGLACLLLPVVRQVRD